MTGLPTERLIAALADEARPVEPLAPPLRRALVAIALVMAGGAALVAAAGDPGRLLARYSGRETLMLLEMAAMLLTGLLAVTGAFFVSVPGRSRRWLLAPWPAFAVWIGLSGLGCYQDLARLGPPGWRWGHSMDCLFFIVVAGIFVGAPLLWRLSRARPIDPLPVALLGGLGAAAFAALLLQFFHPFAVTAIDLGLHFTAVLIVVALASLARRRALAPA